MFNYQEWFDNLTESWIRDKALELQMYTGLRYIECLAIMVGDVEKTFIDNARPSWWWPDFFLQFISDWGTYKRKMEIAGLEVLNYYGQSPSSIKPVAQPLPAK